MKCDTFADWSLLLGLLIASGAQARDLPMCKESDYHFEYTDCDVLGSRWRVGVPNKPDTCTGLPDPVRGTQCTFSCSDGEFLDMKTQECQQCAAGTFSLGSGVAFDEWESLPAGFASHGVGMDYRNSQTNCSNSTWTPRGDYIASNTDECSSTLSYAVTLKKPGSVSFQYFYPDNSIFFEFYVQNDQCQATDAMGRWMKVSESDWDAHYVSLSQGNNVLYWRTTGFALGSSTIRPVLVRNIAISGVAYTSECFHCKPGTYSASPGSAHCAPCPANSYSNKGATVCQPCDEDKYSGIASDTCHPRPPCTENDYFYTHTPCDPQGQTQLMYKWIEPKICSEGSEGGVSLPSSGSKVSCPPCNPGFSPNNASICEPCPHGTHSNGTECFACPVGTEPVIGYEYKWWNQMPGNMRSFVYSKQYRNSERTTAWEVAGEYVYTTPGVQDWDVLMLTLTVPGYSLPTSLSGDAGRTELSRISFVFETQCVAECSLHFMAGVNERNNEVMESWTGTNGRQSYSYLIRDNNTVSFSWAFQRTTSYVTEGQHGADLAKIYSIRISNVVDGVSSRCRYCALGWQGMDSACVACPSGHYMLNGTGVCRPCPHNSIIRPEQPIGEQACLRCGPNAISNKAHTACESDCRLTLRHGGRDLQYDLSPLANVTSFPSPARFTSKGLRYVHQFSLGLCGTEGRKLASCVDNVTESGREVTGYICQSTVLNSDVHGQSVVSSQPVSIGDTLLGVTTDSTLGSISSLETTFPISVTGLPDVIFYYRASETTQACRDGRSTSVRLRCDPTVTAHDRILLPRNCSEGTCDGCSFHFLWVSQHACPLCSESDYRPITSACLQGIQRTTYVWQQPVRCTGGVSLPPQTVSACVTLDFWLKFGVSTGTVAALLLIAISCYFWKKTRRLEYKYSKLMMSAGDKECELPAADSCAIMEGEDAEDDLIYLTKRSFWKIRAFSRERSSDGFDSVPLKSSAGLDMEMS